MVRIHEQSFALYKPELRRASGQVKNTLHEARVGRYTWYWAWRCPTEAYHEALVSVRGGNSQGTSLRISVLIRYVVMGAPG